MASDMAAKASKMMSSVFQKNLTDLVRGIRANKKNEQKYINQCIQECKDEVRKTDPVVKAIAVLKLSYLQMLGYDMTWSAFNVVEVMSSAKFSQKRIGYFAASQSFKQDTEVLILCNNLFKKDLTSFQMYESGIALNALSNVCTPDMARDLVSDIVTLLSHSKPYIRKKACLCLYKVFLQFPGALRPSFPRLREKLDDPDPTVVSGAVNVICELARLNPEKYLPLAPIFFKLLTNSNNNWMLIKIVKLFGSLTPHEPRLAKKLAEPLTNLINSTPAMSLLYECINTCITGLNSNVPVIKLCINKLRMFIEDEDQNLKYLGLLALSRIMDNHPKAVAEHREMVLKCLEDEDVSIRLRALDLIGGMVTKKNLLEIIRRLMDQLANADGQYREDLVEKIVLICSQTNYALIRDFEWYVSILVELTRVRGTVHGKIIASQMLDVAVRVKAVRSFITRNMVNLLLDARFLSEGPGSNSITEVLYAAAWVVGEFADLLDVTQIQQVVESLMQKRVATLPPHIQAVYVQNALKLYSSVFTAAYGGDSVMEGSKKRKPCDPQVADDIFAVLKEQLPSFTQSTHIEVQERACCVLELLRVTEELKGAGNTTVPAQIAALFEEPLNPVATRAQRKVPIPEGLDLDEWINDPPKEDSSSEEGSDFNFVRGSQMQSEFSSDDDNGERRTRGNAARMANPHHLGAYTGPSSGMDLDMDDIPISVLKLDGDEDEDHKGGSRRHGGGRRGGRRGRGRRGRGRRSGSGSSEREKVEYVVAAVEDVSSDDEVVETQTKKPDDKRDALRNALNVDVCKPLGKNDILPERAGHYEPKKKAEAKDDSKSKSKSKSKGRSRGGRGKGKEKSHHHSRGKSKEKSKSKSKSKSKEKVAEVPASTPGGSNLIDFGDMVTSAPISAATPVKEADMAPISSPDRKFEAIGSPPAPAPASEVIIAGDDSGPEEEKKESKRGHSSRRGKGRSKESSRGRSKNKSKSKSKGKGKSKEGEAVTAPAPPAPSATATGGLVDLGLGPSTPTAAPAAAPPSSPRSMQINRQLIKPLCSDDSMSFSYEVVTQLQQPDKVFVNVSCMNQSSGVVSGLEFTIVDTMNLTVIHPTPGAFTIKPGLTLFQGVSEVVPLSFACGGFDMKQQCRGTVTYFVQGDEGQSTQGKQDFKLDFPCSAFLSPVPVSQADFASICGSPDVAASQASWQGRALSTFPESIQSIMSLLRLAPIHVTGDAASCYARSVGNHHVAALIKDRGNGEVSVDLKCSDGGLGSNLISELRAYF